MFNFEPSNYIENEPDESKYFILNKNTILAFNNENFIRPLSKDELKWSSVRVEEKHFIGYLNNNPCFVISALDQNCDLELSSFIDLRAGLGRFPDKLFDVISRSIQIINWSKDHKFCGRCGEEMFTHEKERAMECKTCQGQLIYPRLSPCIITLIYKEDKILLAHNKNFPDNFYSTLAGFIEPGESAEDALRREVMEEVNIKIKNIKYFSSQSWPFPSQLMLGFFAEHESGDIKPDGIEIDDAQWFAKDNLPNVPPANISISGKLIESFVKED